MPELYDTRAPNPPSRAILVGIKLRNTLIHETEESLQELQQLTETAGIEVVATTIQPRNVPNPTYFIGEGKVEDELKPLVAELDADAIIFDEELSPAQNRNLERALEVATIDRTGLILQVFAQRALTKEARLQVALAQLEYALPRLTRMWTHLSRLATGGGGSRRLRGPGETQLEMDRRWVRRNIGHVRKALDAVEKQRHVQRRNRSEKIKVSLVGYTNAGKSTLFNRLTGETVLAEDKLFATLDSTTRKLDLPQKQQILLSDTVGFIKKLPHQLVAAFKATLEEVLEADLLLHVIDVSHPEAEAQIAAVNVVLEELDATDMPMFMVFNKIDRLKSDDEGLHILQCQYPDALPISAQRGDGVPALIEALAQRFAERGTDISLCIPYTEGKALDLLHKHGIVLDTEYATEAVHVKARLPNRYLKSVSQFLVSSPNFKNERH
ncbi:MAG: GTPase HflX [Candidatus Poribacteria bacterium]|nr:GTPase HflX [Candidatus Poribacteria bacterium]